MNTSINPSILSLVPLHKIKPEMRFEAIQPNVHLLKDHFTWCMHPYDITQNESHLTHIQQQVENRLGYYFAVLDKRNNLIGEIAIDAIDYNGLTGNVYYWICQLKQGKGYATQALLLLQQWAREHTTLHYLEIRVEAANIASQRVAVKAGASFIKTISHYMDKNNEESEIYIFSLPLKSILENRFNLHG